VPKPKKPTRAQLTAAANYREALKAYTDAKGTPGASKVFQQMIQAREALRASGHPGFKPKVRL
jgi:hypothetical protein